MIFAPDDFRDNPYVAGLSQAGHVMFGSALTVNFGLIIAAMAFVVWEAVQLRYAGARKHDYYQDCFFWGAGVYMAGSAYTTTVALVLGGIWMGVTWLAK